MNTVVQTDTGHLAVIILHEGVVTHRSGGAVLFDSADIVVCIHPEHGSVGQQVAVQTRCHVIAVLVTVQQIIAGNGAVRSQRHLNGFIAQSTGYRDRNHQGIGIHGNVTDRTQFQFHIAGHRDDLIHTDGLAAVAGADILNRHNGGNHIQVNITLCGCGDNSRIGIDAGHPDIHGAVLGADGSGISDVQHICPDGSVGSAGIGVGYLFHRSQRAAGFTGPFDGNNAVVQGQELFDVHITGTAGGNGECHSSVAGIQASHLAVYVIHGDTGVDITAVGSEELGYDHLQIGIVGNRCAGDAVLIVHNDVSNHAVQECLAGQVVCQILQRDLVGFQFAELVAANTSLTNDHTVQRILAVVGNIHIHAAGGIAQIEACATLNDGVTVATEIGIFLAVVVDKAAVSEVALDSVFVEAVAGNGDLSASVNEVSANHGPGVCVHIAFCLGITFADGVQLNGCIVADIGGSVLRLYGGVDVCPVVGGDICLVNIGICVKVNVLRAVCIHIRTQRRALGVSLTVDIEAADICHDIDDRTFHDCGAGLGAAAYDIAVCVKHCGADVHICIQRKVVVDVGSGSGTKAGCVGVADTVHSVFRAVCLDIDRTEPVADFRGTHIHGSGGIDIGVDVDLCDRNATLGVDACGGGDQIASACFRNDIQCSEVGLDDRAVQNIDGCAAHQIISCADTGCGNEAGTLLGGLGCHVGIGYGMGREVQICIHGTLQIDHILHIHGILALGLFQVDDTAGGAVCAGDDTLCLCIVFRGNADAAEVGYQIGIAVCVSSCVVVAFGGKCLHGNISDHGNISAGLDICRCRTLIVGTDHDVLFADDRAAGNAGQCGLTAVCTGADTGIGLALTELHKGQTVTGLTKRKCVGVCNRLNTDTVGLQINAGQVSMDIIVGVSIASHLTEGDAHHLVGHIGRCFGTGNRASENLHIGSLHGVVAAACNVRIVFADGFRLGLGNADTKQADLGGLFTGGRLTAGCIGCAVGLAIFGAVIDQSLYSHIAGSECTGIVDVCLLLHLQVCVYIRIGDLACADTQFGADTLGIGQTLTQNANIHILTDLDSAAGGQVSCTGNIVLFFVDLCFRQVHRAADQCHADTLAGSGGLGICHSRVISQNFQTARSDILIAVVNISLEGTVGVSLADEHTKGCQTAGNIAAAVVGLGNCLAIGLHADLLGCSQICVHNTGNYIGCRIRDCCVAVDGIDRSAEAGTATLSAAGNDGIGAITGIGIVETGDDADIVRTHICVLNISILAAQQSCFHEVDCQLRTAQGYNGCVEACFCICITSNGNGYVSVLSCRVTLRVAAGNTCSCLNCGICQSNVGTAADHAGGKTLAGLGAHGPGAGAVIVVDADRLALDLLAGCILNIGAEGTACVGINLRQEQGHQTQVAAKLYIASCKGTAVGVDSHSILNGQVRIADHTAVLAAEHCISRVCLHICSCNADTLTAVAAAENCQSAAELIVIVKYAVGIQIGIDSQAASFQFDIFDQRILLDLHVCHSHIRRNADAGNADNGGIDSGFGSCGTVGFHIDIAADADDTDGTGGLITDDTGIDLRQILCDRHVHIHIRSCQLDAAHSGSDDGLCIAEVSIGDIQGRTADVDIHIAQIALGLNHCLEGALCVGIACVQTHGNNTETKRCNIRNSCGLCIIGDPNILCAQVFCSQVCSAGRIGNCVGSACGCVHHADTGGENEGLCHSTEGTLQLVAALTGRNGQAITAEVEVAAAGLLDRVEGNCACNIQIAFAIHLCFLNISQIGHCYGHLNIGAAGCRACQNHISSCKTDCIDCQGIRNQTAVLIACNQSSVVTGVSCDTDVQRCCHQTRGTGDTQNHSLIVIGSSCCTGIHINMTDIHYGVAQIQFRRIICFRDCHCNDRTGANATCRNAGRDQIGIAVNDGHDVDTVSNQILAGNGCLISGGIECQSNQTVAGNQTSGSCHTHTLSNGIGICGNGNISCFQRAIDGTGSIGGNMTDPAMCLKVVDNQNNRCVDSSNAGRNRDNISPCFSRDVVENIHITGRCENCHTAADIGISSTAVDCHGEGSIQCACTAATGSCRTDGSGNTGGINTDIAIHIADCSVTVNSCNALTAKIGTCSRTVDRNYAAAHNTVDSHYLTKVHIAVDCQCVITLLSDAGCGIDGACHNSIDFTENDQCSNTGIHSSHTAANHQGHQPDRGLIGAFRIVVLCLAVVAFCAVLFNVKAAVAADTDTERRIRHCSGLVSHTILTALDALQLRCRLCTCGSLHQNCAACGKDCIFADHCVYIGVENCDGNANTDTADTSRNNTGSNVCIQNITGGNGDIAGCSNAAAGVDDCRNCIFIAHRTGGHCTGRKADIFLLILNSGIFLNAAVLLIVDLGIGIIALSEAAVVFTFHLLVVAFQHSGHFSTVALLSVQSILSCGLTVVILGCEAAIDLISGIHALIDTVMSILRHLIANHNDCDHDGYTAGATCSIRGNTQNISVSQCCHINIVCNDSIVRANGRFHSGEGYIGKCDHTNTCCAANCHTGNNGIHIKCIVALDFQIACRVDVHILTGVCLGGESGNDHIQCAGNTCRAAACDSSRICSDHLIGGSKDLDFAGNLVVCAADGGMCILSSANHICQSLIFEISNNGNSGNRCGTRSGCAGRNIVKICLGIGMDCYILSCIDIAHCCFDLAVEDKYIHIACNSCATAGTKADRQQEDIVIRVCMYRYIARSRSSCCIKLRMNSLVVDQSHYGCANTGGTADSQCACRVN